MILITSKEVYSDTGKLARRKGSSQCFSRSTLLPGDVVENFEEVDNSPSPEVEEAINVKVSEIEAYDSSASVNQFVYQGVPMWLSREDRIVLKDRFERELAKGAETVPLAYEGMVIDISPADGIALINAISGYADQCFDNTGRHKRSVKLLTTLEDIEVYDYTTGYPDKLKF